MMRNIKLTLAYDGTEYHGFQKQEGTKLRTIQQCLEEALGILTQETITLHGSGRTDAGVHAQGQVASFTSQTNIPAERFPLALKSLLPPDIVVWAAQDVPLDFHARISAKRKTYCYTLYNHRHMSPFLRRYAYHVPYPLDVAQMVAGAQAFIGTHDFDGFCAKDNKVRRTVRTLYASRIDVEQPLIRYIVEGDGFLWNMVRIIVGTLLDVGKKKKHPQDIQRLLELRARTLAGMTVPPQGLCLHSVEY